MLFNVILIFCSGFTFAVGGLNLFIGIFNKKDRSYLFFGILSLLASLFLLIHISPISVLNQDLFDFLQITLACGFYGTFLWFISEYTGYVRRKIRIGIVIMVVITYALFFIAKTNNISWSLWESVAHSTIITISIYGIVAGIKHRGQKRKVRQTIFISMMVILLVAAIVYGIKIVFQVSIMDMPGLPISPPDFFPVFFSLIMGSKMSHDVLRSHQLELEIIKREKDWNELMDSINLLVVKLDLKGRITWANELLCKVSGYQQHELAGKDWFNLMLNEDEQTDMRHKFSEILQKEELPFFQNPIKTREGELRDIQWSNLVMRQNDGEVTGVLSIGSDVTEREQALSEIKALKNQLEKENLLLKEEVKSLEFSAEIIGTSDALKYVMKRTQQVSATDSTVLLEGETGVGKDLFASMIHNNSMRRHKPFVKVNCASLPKELIESELFGHEKGSFTGAVKTRQGRFELADRGTIFLDEIGELPLELQPKLLRVLQSGEFERIGSEKTKTVDVRVVTATNRNLHEEVSRGRFRQDLFFRLNVYPITIPPLRQRSEDIPMLIKHFTTKIGSRIGKKVKQISKADIDRLQAYDWPGNVRELENVLERAIISSESETIKLDEDQLTNTMSQSKSTNGQPTEGISLEATQKSHIVSILETCQWKINGENGAASKLGMPPSTLRSKMKKLNIERPKTN